MDRIENGCNARYGAVALAVDPQLVARRKLLIRREETPISFDECKATVEGAEGGE